MKAKIVSENINFERGKDPKNVIGIGRKAKAFEVRNFKQVKENVEGERWVEQADVEMTMDMLKNPKKWGRFCYMTAEKKGQDYLMSELLKEKRDIKYKGIYYYFDGRSFIKEINIQENVNFERGQDPYRALNIGDIKRRDFNSTKSAAKWILRYIDKVADFNLEDFYVERVPDPDIPGGVKLNSKILLNITKWMWQHFTFDGKRSLSSAKYAMHDIEDILKEKRIVKESINFERGGDAKDSLRLGRIVKVHGDRRSGEHQVRLLNPYYGDDVMEDEEIWKARMINDNRIVYVSKYDIELSDGFWGVIEPFIENVDESLDFERGKDIKQSIGIGLITQIFHSLDEICRSEAIKFRVVETSWYNYKTDGVSAEWLIEFNSNGQTIKAYLNKALKEKNLAQYFEFPGHSEGNKYEKYVSYKIKEEYISLFRKMYDNYKMHRL